MASFSVMGETVDAAGATTAHGADERMQWLNSRSAPAAATTPKAVVRPKISFRTSTPFMGTRSETPSNDAPATEAHAAESHAVARTTPVEAAPVKTHPAEGVAAVKPVTADSVKKTTEALATNKAAATPPPKPAAPTPVKILRTTAAAPTPAKTRVAETFETAKPGKAESGKAPMVAEAAVTKSPATDPRKANAVALAKLTTPYAADDLSKVRPVELRPAEKEMPSLPPIAEPPSRRVVVVPPPRAPRAFSFTAASGGGADESRYPWKTSIVTTVFWVGEPVGGHNFTPNYASSWDAHWKASYGGFDNPDPDARRNFIPVKFVPRQNPFYVALPYNDVTHGRTKPEARQCIPWFREAFRKEGESVCRNRWVAIRNQAGRIAYAQWSDCGPFRTDHWQYVFGNEKPKPNLNKGAGLDVSPAVRDYLGLSSTDVTDWKFVELKDLPNGPWALHGDNNTYALKNARAPKTAGRAGGRTPTVLALGGREF